MPRPKSEYGALGLPIFSGYVAQDHNRKLRGREAIAVYREMLYDEPAAAAVVSAALALLRTDVQVQPGGETPADARAARILEQSIEQLRDGIDLTMRRFYSAIWAGWSLAEIVYRRTPDGDVGWGALAYRRQDSLHRWEHTPEGVVTAFQQRPAPDFQIRTIPLNRCVHVTFEDAEGSPEGRSALRSMYRQWYFVKNIEQLMGISLERFGTGIPVFEAEAGVTIDPAAQAIIEEQAAAIRQNENAYVITPAGIKFRFEPSPGLSAADFLSAIQRMRAWMLSTAMADFIALGMGDQGGAYALGKDKSELFLMALNGFQQRVLGALNAAADRLLRYTFAPGELTAPPTLNLPTIKRYDLESLGAFSKVLHDIGALHVTPDDEHWFRKISDLVDVTPEQLQELFDEEAAAAARMPSPEPSDMIDAPPEMDADDDEIDTEPPV